jgi:hypothetical protein
MIYTRNTTGTKLHLEAEYAKDIESPDRDPGQRSSLQAGTSGRFLFTRSSCDRIQGKAASMARMGSSFQLFLGSTCEILCHADVTDIVSHVLLLTALLTYGPTLLRFHSLITKFRLNLGFHNRTPARRI